MPMLCTFRPLWAHMWYTARSEDAQIQEMVKSWPSLSCSNEKTKWVLRKSGMESSVPQGAQQNKAHRQRAIKGRVSSDPAQEVASVGCIRPAAAQEIPSISFNTIVKNACVILHRCAIMIAMARFDTECHVPTCVCMCMCVPL